MDNTYKHYNTEEWREPALHFEQFGRYTNHPPNNSPESKYYKYWKEQARRSVYGYNIGRDWIPGYLYFYLNFSRIEKAIAREGVSDDIFQQVQGDRIESFPDFWDGDYEWFHYLEECEKAGRFAACLKTRGRGYSYKGGSMFIRNYSLIPNSKSYAFAYEKEYLLKDGIITKAWDCLDWVETHTAWGHRRTKIDQDMHKRASYVITVDGRKIEKGYKSEVIAVTFRDEPEKSRGKRGKLILYEEGGKFPYITQSWNIGISSMRQGRITYGLQAVFGTGGTEGADFMGLEELFYYPEKYEILPHRTPYDKTLLSPTGAGKTGFFMPEYINLEGAMDNDGNSNIDLAMSMINNERKNKKEGSKNPEAYVRFVAEKPCTAQEAVLRVGGTLFPINDLKDHLAEVETNEHLFSDMEQVGHFTIGTDDEIKFNIDSSCIPVADFPIKDDGNIDGAVVIWEHPVKDVSGNVPFGLYIAGNDAYDHDDSTTTSLGSTFIMNSLTGRIVAEYTGRPLTANMYYENCRRLIMYYNAIMNYENNLKGIFSHFDNRYSSYMMADTPEIIKDKIASIATINRGKGTPGTPEINRYGRELSLNWLVTPQGKDSNRLMLHTIRSIPLLKELIYWNKDQNFDRVSALGMLMILREDRVKFHQEETKKVATLSSSPFWKRSFDNKNGIVISRKQWNPEEKS